MRQFHYSLLASAVMTAVPVTTFAGILSGIADFRSAGTGCE